MIDFPLYLLSCSLKLVASHVLGKSYDFRYDCPNGSEVRLNKTDKICRYQVTTVYPKNMHTVFALLCFVVVIH